MSILNSDGSASDTSTQITAASNGDTVLLPASGSFGWSAVVAIPSTKYITVDLNGSTITLTNAGSISISAHASGNNRITNGTVIKSGTGYTDYAGPIKIVDARGSAALRVDNIDFISSGTGGGADSVLIDLNAQGAGVMDHCNFTGMGWADEFIHINGWGSGNDTGWTVDSGDTLAGSADLFYIEDCTFTGDGGPNGVSWIECFYGCRFAIRYCAFDWVSLDTHGGGGISARWFELYNNTFDNNTSAGQQPGFAFSCRGGTGVVHDNSMHAGAGHAVRNGFCWEAGGGNYTTYRPGRGLDSGSGPVLDPVRVWGNNTITLSLNDCDADSGGGTLVLNTDVYASARPGYTAYTYPHPLVSGETPTPGDMAVDSLSVDSMLVGA